jgi:hypothetical protein
MMGHAASVVFVFVAVFALDFAWAAYTKAVGTESAGTAAVYSMVIYLLGGAVVVQYVASPWLLLPAVGGAFCGTFLAVRQA